MSIPNKIKVHKIRLGILIFLSVFSIGFTQEKTTKSHYVQGELTNKLQFFVQQNNPQKAETLFYFVVKTGAIQENKNELGYAHFLEHMAFKNGKRFPKKKFTQFLKEQGLQIGVHYNAVTNYDYTLYEISIPKKADLFLQKQILLFFADIIDGLTLHQKDIETEKKIVLAEKEVAPPLQKHFLFKLGESLYKKRSPIGTEKSINTITTKKLKAFYKKWYQPKNAGVFVVGNINPKQTTKLIKQVFKKCKNTTNRKSTQPNLYKQLKNKIAVEVDTTKIKNKLHLELALLHKPKSKKEKIAGKIFRNILQNRIDIALNQNTNTTQIYNDYFLSNVNYYSISLPIKNNILQVTKTVLTELKRISELGVSKKELAYYLKKQKSYLKQTPLTNSFVIKKLSDVFLKIEKYNYPKTYKHSITSNNIRKIATKLYKDSKKRVFVEVLSSNKQEFTTQKFNELLREISHQKLEKFTFTAPKKKKVEKINYALKTTNLSEVTPISKKYFQKLGITKITYKNGLEILLKPLKTQTKEIKITGFAQGGTSFLPDSLYTQYESTVSYMDLGGIANLNYDELNNYLADKDMGVSLNISEYQRSFFGFTEEKHKVEFFNYLYLKLTEARKDEQEFHKIIAEEIADVSKKNKTQKILMASKEDFKIAELTGTYFPNRKIAETANDYKKLNLSKMNHFYKQAFSYSNDWKIIITGNFNTEEILPLANKYFGNLKRTLKPITNKMLFNRGNFKKHFTFKTDNQKVKTVANTLLFYSTYRKGLKNTLLQSLFKRMLQDKVVDLLREKHGIVYTPVIKVENQARFTVIKISYHCKSSDVKKAKQILLDWFINIEKNKISQSDFDSYKKQILIKYKSVLNSKETFNWVFSLRNSIKNGDRVDELESFEKILDDISIVNFYKSISNSFNINTVKTIEVYPN